MCVFWYVGEFKEGAEMGGGEADGAEGRLGHARSWKRKRRRVERYITRLKYKDTGPPSEGNVQHTACF